MKVRKVVLQVEDLHVEGPRQVDVPVRTAIAAAVIRNPWSGRGYVEDLSPEIEQVAPQLAGVLVPRVIEAMGGADGIEAFGKAAAVGSAGEVEHAAALIHTLRFGNRFREAAGGESFLSFTNVRVAPGSLLSLPMVHKNDRSQRSHFLTGMFQIPDAPLDEEIVVAIGAASSGRPFARIGHRQLDAQSGAV